MQNEPQDGVPEEQLLLACLLRPENQQMWKSSTLNNLKSATELTQSIFQQLQEHDKAWSPPPLSPTLSKTFSKGFTRDFERKMAPISPTNVAPRKIREFDSNMDLFRTTLDRLDGRIQKGKMCMQRTQHTHNAMFAALKVCQWRLELRTRRPPQELFHDKLQEALEQEQTLLSAGRKRLEAVMQQGSDTLGQLLEVRAKQHRKITDALNPAGALPESETNEALVKRAEALMASSARLLKDMDSEVANMSQQCNAANAKVLSSIAQRIKETLQLKLQIEEQVAQLDKGIAAAQNAITKSRSRYGKADMGPLQNKVEGTETLLEKLLVSKRALEEDLRCKFASYKIDDQCRRVPPHVTPSHKSPVTRDYSGLVSVLSMTASMSAPNLGRASTAGAMSAPTSPLHASASGGSRPTSPAGTSEALRAAASGAMA